MVWAGAVIVFLTFAAVIKKYDTRLCLFIGAAGMAFLSGHPWPVMDAFVATMTNRSIVPIICSCMGFVYVMRYTECDKNLIHALANPIKKLKLFIIPTSTIATYFVMTAISSAAGSGAAVGAILIPIMLSAGVHPAIAGGAILAGTFGNTLSPGSVHMPVIAAAAKTDVISVIANHLTASLASLVTTAAVLTLVAFILKEHRGHAGQAGTGADTAQFKVNYIKALIPLVPLALLVGSSKQMGLFPEKFFNVPLSMIIGSLCCYLSTVKVSKPVLIVKEFFGGMGHAYAHVIGLIIAATCFTKGMEEIGLIAVIIDSMKNAKEAVMVINTVVPFGLGALTGSGDAATMTWNTAITPHAASFGMTPMDSGSLALIAGALGRSMSPVAAVTIICAGFAGTSPVEICKRTAPGAILATAVTLLMLAYFT